MPASLFLPEVSTEIAFTTDPTGPIAGQLWTDVTPWVEADQGAETVRGRSDEHSTFQPATHRVTLDNTDGRFTPGNAAGAYYPNVKLGRMIRQSMRWPLGTSGNILLPSRATFNSITGWGQVGLGAPSFATSTAQAFDGTQSMLVTWAASASPEALGWAMLDWRSGIAVVAGRTYTASAYFYVPAGSPDPRIEIWDQSGTSIAQSSRTTTKGAWSRVSVTFTAPDYSLANGLILLVVQVASASSGQQCYVDAMMLDEGTTLGAWTSSPPPIYRRYTGYIDSWQTGWADGTPSRAVVNVTASSRFAQLGSQAPLRDLLGEEYLLSSPTALYTLGESAPENATSTTDTTAVAASNSSNYAQPQAVQVGHGTTTNAAINWGQATGPPTDSLTAAWFVPDVGTGWYTLETGPLNPTAALIPGITLEMWVSSNNHVGSGLGGVARLNFAGGALRIYFTSTGLLGANFDNPAGTGSTTFVGTPSSRATNLTYQVAVILTATGVNQVQAEVIVGGISQGFVTGGFGYTDPGGTYLVSGPASLVLGSDGVNPFWGVLAQVAYFESALASSFIRIDHNAVGKAGWTNSAGGFILLKYAAYAGIPTADVDTSDGTMGTKQFLNIDTTGQTPLAVFQAVEETENGTLFDGADGRLKFLGRLTRYNPVAAVTLDAAAQEIEADFAPVLDGFGLVNDVTATRPSGTDAAELTARSLDTGSQASYGLAHEDVTVYTMVDSETQDAADWRVAQGSQPQVRAPAISVAAEQLTASQYAALLALDVGSVIALTNLPSQAPATTLQYFVEGYTETFDGAAHRITFNVSPATQALYGAWVLDSASYSQLDSTTRVAY